MIAPSRDDQKYFAIVPHIVWVTARDGYDLILWYVVKMIAGDDGQCSLGTRDLARACGMSVGKISDCRDYLIDQGLLVGEIVTASDGRSTWQLRVPDLWPRNVAWREMAGNSLLTRIDAREEFHAARSSHERTRSSHERTRSPHERTRSPHERAQAEPHHIENQEEEPRRRTNKENDDDGARANGNGSSSSLSTWDDLIDEFGRDEVLRAMELAGKRENDLRYVLGILRNRNSVGRPPKKSINPYNR